MILLNAPNILWRSRSSTLKPLLQSGQKEGIGLNRPSNMSLLSMRCFVLMHGRYAHGGAMEDYSLPNTRCLRDRKPHFLLLNPKAFREFLEYTLRDSPTVQTAEVIIQISNKIASQTISSTLSFKSEELH
jgi:hypothetical protein